MSLIIPEDLPDCIDKPVEKAFTPVSENIGKTLGDLWFLVMGGISHTADKRRIKYAITLDEYKKSIESKVSGIPLERRTEPNIQVACQALEDSIFCVENKTIREMFANLIASTMDNKICDKVHPSFSAILKQMLPKDALFLTKFIGNVKLPVCEFVRLDINGEIKLHSRVYFKEKDTSLDEMNSNSFVISTLESLGLVRLDFSGWLNDDKLYRIYEDSDIFQKYKESNSNTEVLKINKGYAELTVFGSEFVEICCPPTKVINVTLTYPNI